MFLLACTGAPPTDDSPTDTAAPACTTEDVDLPVAFEHVIFGEGTDCEVEAVTDFSKNRSLDMGPWKQDIQLAFSEDAQTFSPLDEIAMETAAVPEVVVDADDRYWMFYVDGSFDHLVELAEARSTWMLTHGVPGIGALRAAVSDDGRTWEPVEDFGIEGLVQGMVVDPDVVRQPDGTWRMYYVGMPIRVYITEATWIYPEEHVIYWASSDDLVHWVQQGEVVTGPYADPSVLCHPDDRCVMASFGIQWGRSTDGGQTFTHEGLWAIDGFAPEFMRFEDGSVRMFLNGMALGAPIISMYAPDGETFAGEDGFRMPEAYGEAVTLARAKPSGWYMWYHTFKPGIELPE